MDLARYVEHTLLRADATPEHVAAHCREAAGAGLLAVCISPLYVAHARTCLAGTSVRLVTVAGFPLGANTPSVKAEEARQAVADGAQEVDMVMAVGLALAGDFSAVEHDVRVVREAIPRAILKVILETGFLAPPEMQRAAEAAVRAGAHFVKTSTGFGPRGATASDVRLLVEQVKGRAEVKASGGIRTAAAALEMIAAGATRIGTSNGVDVARGPT